MTSEHTDCASFPIDSNAVDTNSAITLADLPPPDTKRWITRRKAQVVAGVRCGVITLDEACHRYNLSVEEFLTWQRLIDRHGPGGLRITRIQQYRREDQEDQPAR